MACFATVEFEHEFSGAESHVGGHQLSPCIRHIDDLATHAGMTIIVNDDSLLQRSSAGMVTSLLRRHHLMLVGVADSDLGAPAPYDLTAAGFATLQFEH